MGPREFTNEVQHPACAGTATKIESAPLPSPFVPRVGDRVFPSVSLASRSPPSRERTAERTERTVCSSAGRMLRELVQAHRAWDDYDKSEFNERPLEVLRWHRTRPLATRVEVCISTISWSDMCTSMACAAP